ncbi:MAG: hypothetical protein R8F63_10365 [Acidimicrobiales bacterium]|nr:hypothetical protein [Acidimicrobiales bacterium]
MGSIGLTRDDFLEPDVVIQLGYPPVRIDILTSISGVSFDECWDKRVVVDIGSVEVGVISTMERTFLPLKVTVHSLHVEM